GGGNGRPLPRDLGRAVAFGVAQPQRARSPVKSAQAVAGVAPRSAMTSSGRVHIVGAGLAGLAAAARLIAEGRDIALYESSQHAGGRCRSYLDAELGIRIDNGNHLLLAGNTAALAY